MLFVVFLHKSHTLEKYDSSDISQNAVGQSDCKLTVSLEQNYEKASFFACWYRFMEIKSWLKNVGMGLVKNGYGHSGLWTVKLAIFPEGINGVNWFLVCW